MAKLSFFTFLLVIISNYLSSQEIILNFIPANNTLTIDSIQATNLTTNNSITVQGGGSVNLIDISTSTNEFELLSENSKVYPNPFQQFTTLQFTSTNKEKIKLILINPIGKSITTFNQNLLPGNHQFNIATKSPGIYFINIQSEKRNISFKLVNLTKGSRDKIEYSGTTGEEVTNKSSVMIQSEQVIHFKLFSGNNVTIISDSPTEPKTYEVEFYECKDVDGQHYPIVQIGEQWWMAKNLATDTGEDNWYFDQNLNAIFGRLYKWETALSICPMGWHLPTYDEWRQLAKFVSDQIITNYLVDEWDKVGIHLKANSSWDNNGNGVDDYGFSGLPGGFGVTGGYAGINQIGSWWSSTEATLSDSWNVILHGSSSQLTLGKNPKESGFSVRCIKD